MEGITRAGLPECPPNAEWAARGWRLTKGSGVGMDSGESLMSPEVALSWLLLRFLLQSSLEVLES